MHGPLNVKYVEYNTGMRRITTFRSMMNRI